MIKLGVASFSPDGARIVTASGVAGEVDFELAAQVWNAATGAPIGKPLEHQRAVYGASFSPDGAWVLTASRDSTARMWDASTGEPIGKPFQHIGDVTSALFSPDGKRIVTVSATPRRFGMQHRADRRGLEARR